jgi:hypothetical protein
VITGPENSGKTEAVMEVKRAIEKDSTLKACNTLDFSQ